MQITLETCCFSTSGWHPLPVMLQRPQSRMFKSTEYWEVSQNYKLQHNAWVTQECYEGLEWTKTRFKSLDSSFASGCPYLNVPCVSLKMTSVVFKRPELRLQLELSRRGCITLQALILLTQAAYTTRPQCKQILKPEQSQEKSQTGFKIRWEAAIHCDMLPLLVPGSHVTAMRPKATVASKLKLLRHDKCDR